MRRERERKTDRPHSRPQFEDIGLKSAKESEKSELWEDYHDTRASPVKNANAMVGSETRVQCIPYPSSNTPLQRTLDGSTLFFFEFLFIRNYCTVGFFFFSFGSMGASSWISFLAI